VSCELHAPADIFREEPRSRRTYWIVGWMCSRSGPGNMVSGSSWSTSLSVSAQLDYSSLRSILVRKTGSLHFCVVLSFPRDTSCCYQATVAVNERAVFGVALLAKSCRKVRTASIRQYKDLPTLQWVSFTHNEVLPRFRVFSILFCQRLISNTPSYPNHPAIVLWIFVFLRVPIRIPHGSRPT
jgi:hypothetical protein